MTVTDAFAEALTTQFRALNARLRRAVDGLATPTLDLAPAPGENPIAVIVAHTVGSEMGWLHLAADRPHARDRDAEFRTLGKSAGEIVALVDEADAKVGDLLSAAAAQLDATRTTNPNDGNQWTVARCIAHSLSHTAEHVGHAELTRQLLAKRG